MSGFPGRRTSARWHLQTRQPWSREGEALILQGRETRLTIRFLSDTGYFGAKDWEHDGPLTTFTWSAAYDRNHNLHPMLLSFGEARVEHRWTPGGFEIALDCKRWRYDVAARRLDRVSGA